MSRETDVTLDRNRGIGGSDIPAVMGDSPFVSRWELLQYKAGIKENDFKGNEYTRYGQMIEPKIRDFVNETYNAHFEPDYTEDIQNEDLSYFYHSDGCDSKREEILEIKSTSAIALPEDAGDNFKAYALEFYRKYVEQLLFGMRLHHYDKGMLAVYERPADMSEEFDPWRLQVFEIDLKEDSLEPLWKEIKHALFVFETDLMWLKKHGDRGELDLPSRSVLAVQAEGTIKIDDEYVPIVWLLKNKKAIMDAYKDISGKFLKGMEEDGIKSLALTDLGIKVSYVSGGKDTVERVLDEAAFKEDHPDLWEKYQVERVKKGKASSVRFTVQKQAQ